MSQDCLINTGGISPMIWLHRLQSLDDSRQVIPSEYLYGQLLQKLYIMFGRNGYSLTPFIISTNSICSGRLLSNRLILEEMQYEII
jgi:hypothetical protein